MAYLDDIKQHWAISVQLACLQNANDLQLQCMRDLAESEFGYASNMCLRRECFWSTRVDKDGDVVLSFLEPGARVNVYIDHLAIITTKDLNSGETVVYDPSAELAKWPGSKMIWVLDNRLLKPFTKPSLRVDPVQRTCEITERRLVLSPFYFTERYTSEPEVTQIAICDSERYARLNGELHWFEVMHTDEVSRERVLVLCELSRIQKTKAHFNRLVGWLEDLTGWNRDRAHCAALRLPRFSTKGFGAKQSSYCAL